MEGQELPQGRSKVEVKVTEDMRNVGSERADALRQISLGAQVESRQSPGHAEFQRMLPICLTPKNPPVWFLEFWS